MKCFFFSFKRVTVAQRHWPSASVQTVRFNKAFKMAVKDAITSMETAAGESSFAFALPAESA
ncbi:MAG: hypothetical protein QF721_08315 [Verrucomicrobiota bacterium]|nr:hypothetical protein [Verrucomicrobiota bacterium]